MVDEGPGRIRNGPRPDAAGPRDLLYRGLFDHAHLEVHMWEVIRDAVGEIRTWRLVDANPAALRSWGRRLEEVIGRTTDEIFPGVNASETFLPIVSEIMATGTPREWEVDFPGTDQVLHMVSFPVGEHFVSTGFDVTHMRRQASALQDALQSLEQATRAGGVGLWDWDLRTDQVRYSDEWKRQLGHRPDEVADSFQEWKQRVHPDDLGPAMDVVRRNVASAGQNTENVFRMRHKDGSYRWILAQSSVLTDDDGKPVRMLGSHVDITERRRLEERVMETQKLESVGTLAAGIAHDFNNLLTAITGNLALARELDSGDPNREACVRDALHAAEKAQALTTQLLTFAKGGSPVREVASIAELVEESASFVTRGSSARCEFDIGGDLANVEADVGQISQVINNLVINARQAMPDGGVIRITARNQRVVPGDGTDLSPGEYVTVSVSDEGPGIAEENLGRIFDPFFTTKPSGSGLGLSTSYAIVTKHGGRLTVDSRPGAGTTFRLFLPASDVEVAPPDREEIVPGSGRILVMDDKPAVRTLLERLLGYLGYRCDTVADGDEARARYGEALATGDPYHAVILDLTIPGRPGGQEVLKQLQTLDPDVVGIVASGYSESDVLADHAKYGFRGRLRKPTELAALSREIARVLTSPA